MKRLITLFISVIIGCVYSNAQSVSALNYLFSAYNQNIKVCNHHNPYYQSCIYEAKNIKAEIQGKYLLLSFGFGDDRQNGCLSKDLIKIDLSSATFYTGFWSNSNMEKIWKHTGPKEILTIEDKNGFDYFSTGQKSYNQGTNQTLLSKFYISCETEPIANKVINEIYAIQERFKDKEAWLLSTSIPETTTTTSPNNKTTNKHKEATDNKNETAKKLGKYVQ